MKIAAAARQRRGSSRGAAAAIVAVLVVVAVALALWLPNRDGENSGATPGTVPGAAGTPDTPGAAGTPTATPGTTSTGPVTTLTTPGTTSVTPATGMCLPATVKDANAPVVATNGGVLRDGVPTLQVFEDVQCPVCKRAELLLGPRIRDLGDAGRINVVYYVKTFLDDNLRNDGSTKAGNAALCAADAGRFAAYHDKIFDRQPANEGDGFSDDAINAAATDAGLAGSALDTWRQCVATKPYVAYLRGLERYTSASLGVNGTPTFRVDGKPVSLAGVQTADDFEKALFAAAR